MCVWENMKKGTYGYLHRKRIFSIVKSVLFLAAVLLIYFAALRHFHTNKNVFSILAAVGALPTGRSIVESVMCLRAVSASAAVQDAVSGIRGMSRVLSGYDLCLTAYERAYSVSHLAVGQETVLGLTEDPGTDPRLCGQHIAKTLAGNGLDGYSVRILNDRDAYCRELSRLCASAEDAGGDIQETDRHVMNLLLAVSL